MGTITEEISRIKSAKADIKTAIENKGTYLFPHIMMLCPPPCSHNKRRRYVTNNH